MGLDPPTLSSISTLLYRLAEKSSPRVVIALRPQDPIPEWITHVVYLDSDTSLAHQGSKEMVLDAISRGESPKPQFFPVTDLKRKARITTDGSEQFSVSHRVGIHSASERTVEAENEHAEPIAEGNEALVEMKGVEVKYGDKQVLGAWQQKVDEQLKSGLWWTVKRGERWGIFGPNGTLTNRTGKLFTKSYRVRQNYSPVVDMFGSSADLLPTHKALRPFSPTNTRSAWYLDLRHPVPHRSLLT